MDTKSEIRKQQARLVCTQLSSRYKTAICNFDPTAVMVIGITDNQHSELCKKLKCSGHYSEKSETGFLTNFGEYK